MYKNFDLDNIITPVNVSKLREILTQTGYDKQKTEFLISGFSEGFSLGYQGSFDVKLESKNLKLKIGSETKLWNKVMKEVQNKRYAGPFRDNPFSDGGYIQLPIGLVPKDNGKSTRLIFHLSYPQNSGLSVNENTPEEICSVKYPDFSEAVKLCLAAGKSCACAKSDWKSAFRHFPMSKKYWRFLLMRAQNPTDKQWYYFVDKCMPFGSSISCAHFQAFSNAIAFVMRKDLVNYLDDFLFIAFLRWMCNQQVNVFLDICEKIRFPVSPEKTVWATTSITFLGMLLDTVRQIVCIPEDKISKAIEQINAILKSRKRKAKVVQIQKLCGLLNFLCRAIVPGCSFTMRLYQSLTGKLSKLQPYHHVKLPVDCIQDLRIWLQFLQTPDVFCRPFIDFTSHVDATQLCWFTGAAKAIGKGYGGHYKSHWFTGVWEEKFLNECNPSIKYLELYAVTVSILLWLRWHKNSRIVLYCDNERVVFMINKQSFTCKICMVLLRIITLQCMIDNTRLYATHVGTRANGRADALSRNDYHRFMRLSLENGITPDKYRNKYQNCWRKSVISGFSRLTHCLIL